MDLEEAFILGYRAGANKPFGPQNKRQEALRMAEAIMAFRERTNNRPEEPGAV